MISGTVADSTKNANDKRYSLDDVAGDFLISRVAKVGGVCVRKAMICQRWASGKCAKDGMPVVSDPLRKIENSVPGAAP
jgi:hypothetical protein